MLTKTTALMFAILVSSTVFAAGKRRAPEPVRIDDMLVDMAEEVSTRATPAALIVPWPDARIPIRIPSNVSAAQRQLLFDACSEWTKASKLHCVVRTNEVPYVELTLKSDGCYASIGSGWILARKRSFNLAQGCWARGTIIHEIGHLMGLMHEQQRPDRDNYVDIQWDNIKDSKRWNFIRIAAQRTGQPYDFLSIMHYPKWAFSKDGSDTIVPRPGYEGFKDQMGQRIGLSDEDKKTAALLYGR